jgi:hypothetical protein
VLFALGATLKISARGAFKDLDAPRLVDQWIGLIGDCPAIASVASIRVRTLVIPIGVMKFFSVEVRARERRRLALTARPASVNAGNPITFRAGSSIASVRSSLLTDGLTVG